MKRCFLKGILLSAVLFLSTFVTPSNAQSVKALSIEELFQIGLENSLKLQSSCIHVDIAGDTEQTARIGRLPDISTGITGGYIGQPTIFTNGLSGAVHPETPDWMQNYNFELFQPLYRGGKIRYNIEKTSLEKQIALLNLEKDKAEIKMLLISKYLDLFRLYKQKDVLNQNIEDAKQRLHDIRQMKKEGMITTNDVIRSELLLTNYELAFRETEDNIVIISQQLDVALGFDENLLLLPDTTVLNENYPVLIYETYVQQAYSQHPELKIAQTEISLSEKKLQLTRSDNFPSLSLRAANNLQRPITSTSPPQDLFMNTWNVSLVLSYKLSSFYQNKHNIITAKRTILLQKIQKDQEMQNIRMNVKASFIKHKEAMDRIRALSISVDQANENYRIVQNRYFNQIAVLTDLLDASSVRLDAELQLIVAKANSIYTYYQLLKSSGNL